MHAEFNHEQSDFMAWLNLWEFLNVQKERLSNSQFRKMCRQRYISALPSNGMDGCAGAVVAFK